MGFRVCDPLGTNDEFIRLGMLRKEHLNKGLRTGQEDGTNHLAYTSGDRNLNTMSVLSR